MQLPLKSFDEMTPADYADIGYKSGLEVHQQLLTRTKLFCRCPAGHYSTDYDAEILRHMRPTLSELGEYDGTALMEKKTRKNIYYRIHRDTVCTYEFDDTPPFLMSDEALDIAIEQSLLLNLNIVGELHIARKQYLDGSIPTGFQRTAIIGVGGWIPYGDRRIGITQLSIEEDSCREVSDLGHDRVLLTDRLGMPLSEVVTDPDMRTPQELAEVCQLIRRLARATGKVRTGYGAAREDVNVSVRGGTRVEIKGVPQIWRIPRLAYNEAMRQVALLGIRESLRGRGVTPQSFSATRHDVTKAIAKARYEPIRAALSDGARVMCVVLPGFRGLLGTPIQEHTTFAKEFSDRVRVIACLTRIPNIVHSDTATEALTARDWKELYRKTRSSAADALVLVWGDPADTATACDEIVNRAREATEGVPSDTRQALADGTTGFERVLPGAERMYPDTDLPPLALTVDRIERIRQGMPADFWDREQRLDELRVPLDARSTLSLSPRGRLFARLVDELGVDPTFAAVVLTQHLKAYRRAGWRPERLDDEVLLAVFRGFGDGRYTREGVLRLLKHLLTCEWDATDPGAAVEAAVAALELAPIDSGEIAAVIDQTRDALDPAAYPTAAKRRRAIIGGVMRQLRGRVEGRQVAELVRQFVPDDVAVGAQS